MRQYSIDNVELSWLSLDLKEGLAEGTSITEARNAPTFTQKMSGLGKGRRVYNPDRSGTVSIVMDQESVTHQKLKGIANSEKNPATRDKVGNLVLRDLSSGEEIRWKNAYITSIPDRIRGTESQTFTWVFAFEDFEDEEVTNLLNTVGN